MRLRLTVFILVLATVFVGLGSFNLSRANEFKVEVLDVGQGDAILISTPSKLRILIDGGPGDQILTALGKSLPFFDRRIDVIISTHPDADHIEGLIPVIKKYKVRAVLRTDANKDTQTWRTFNSLISEKKLQDEKIYLGDTINLADGVNFQVLWPPAGELNKSEPNESSIVTKLSYKEADFILTGDIGSFTENRIAGLVKPEVLQAEVLKVAHHGSRFSSADVFLEKVKPEIAAISVGANNFYGHPTPEALSRLKAADILVFRTDEDGKISFKLSEKGLVVSTEK